MERGRVIPKNQRNPAQVLVKTTLAGLGALWEQQVLPLAAQPTESTASVRRRRLSSAEQLQESKVPLALAMPWIRLAANNIYKIYSPNRVWHMHRDHECVLLNYLLSATPLPFWDKKPTFLATREKCFFPWQKLRIIFRVCYVPNEYMQNYFCMWLC